MLGDRRLGDVERRRNLTGRQFPVPDEGEDLSAHGGRESLEDLVDVSGHGVLFRSWTNFSLLLTIRVGAMAKTDVWPIIHAERRALAQLEGIDDQAWGTASLCADWTVQDVLAHMTATTRLVRCLLPKLIGIGFSLKKMQSRDIARERDHRAPRYWSASPAGSARPGGRRPPGHDARRGARPL